MTGTRLKILPARAIIFLAAVIAVFLILCPASYSYTEKGEGSTSKIQGKTGTESLIERKIPSRESDLFVVLKNGMTILIREVHTSDVVSCEVLVKTGSVYEGDRTGAGISHYLEHVVSGGTTSRYTESEIKEKVQALGGATNAYTSYDKTGYYINTTGHHYGDALEILLNYVTGCLFKESEYKREKPVIIQEFQMNENNPSRQLWSLFMKTAYRENPVRYPVIGEREIFLRMDKADLVSHYRRWYTTDNMVVSVVGNLKKEEALAEVVKLTSELKNAVKPPYVLPEEPPQLAPRHAEKSVPMARLTQAQIGFRTVKLSHPDLYPLDVLAVALGDGRTSRLYRKLRDQKGLVLDVGCGSWTPSFVQGQLLVSMDLSGENLSKAVEALWEELTDIKKYPIGRKALEGAKNKVAADFVFSQESMQNQASQLARDWMSTGNPYFSEKYVSGIEQVTPADIRRVAKKYIKEEHMTTAVIKPPQSSSALKSLVSQGPDKKHSIKEVSLPNRMKLLMKKNPSIPVVIFEYFAKGGLRYEPEGKNGISRFMAELLTKGTRTRDKMEIAGTVENLGGSINSGSGQNSVYVSVSVLKEHFDTALDLLADVIQNPSFSPEEIEKQRKETLLQIKRLDENWAKEITRIFKELYYENHPYKNDTIGTRESVESLSRKEIRKFYDSIIMPNNSVLAVFGDIEPTEVAGRVKRAFRHFKPGNLKKSSIAAETSNINSDSSIERTTDKTSAAILAGYNGLTIRDRDVPVVHVIDAIISGIGYPSGWLHDALRGGDRSLVYYVHAYPSFGIDGGYFGVLAQTTVNNCDKVVGIIKEKMELIQKSKVDAETLNRAKDMCITMHKLRLEKTSAQASSSALDELLGLGSGYDERYPPLIRAVNAEDVLRVAKELFNHHMIVITKPETETASRR